MRNGDLGGLPQPHIWRHSCTDSSLHSHVIRAKQKIDATRHTQYETSGGLAPPELTQAEEELAATLESRPGIHGIVGGVDTDDFVTVEGFESVTDVLAEKENV